MTNSELEQLKEELDKYWNEYKYEGGILDEELGFETVDVVEAGDSRWGDYMDVITRGPSGQLYKWHYFRGATEMQEDMREDKDVTPVKLVEKEVTKIVKEYVVE